MSARRWRQPHQRRDGAWARPTSWPPNRPGPHEVDIRADLYSLGCTFYYLLTGQVPFPGGTHGQQADSAISRPSPRRSKQHPRPDLPPALPPFAAPASWPSAPRTASPPRPRRRLPSRHRPPSNSLAPPLAAVHPDYVKDSLPDTIIARPASRSTLGPCASPAYAVRWRSPWQWGIARPPVALASLAAVGRVSGGCPRQPDRLLPQTCSCCRPSPDAERFDWQPKELAAVLGEDRLRHWDQVRRGLLPGWTRPGQCRRGDSGSACGIWPMARRGWPSERARRLPSSPSPILRMDGWWPRWR